MITCQWTEAGHNWLKGVFLGFRGTDMVVADEGGILHMCTINQVRLYPEDVAAALAAKQEQFQS